MKVTGCECLTDFNRIVKASLRRGPVLVCYLDGLGYYGYRKALEQNRLPYIKEHFWVNPMRTVFPPLTNPAMATMLTGEEPEVHGVVSRKEHRTKVPTIFAEFGKSAAVIEGDSIIVQTEIRQRLHTASEKESMDMAVYQGALEAMEEGAAFLFVHFHGIDDAGHDFGPYAEETMDRIEETGRFVAGLCGKWKGECFLISDHGLHATADGGDHGTADAPGAYGGDHGMADTPTADEEDRTIIFGWGGDTFDGRMDMKDFLEMLALDYETKQVVFYGSDEFACACSDREIRKGKNVFLARQKPETVGEESWRLVVEEDVHNRRWCKDVVEIELRRT